VLITEVATKSFRTPNAKRTKFCRFLLPNFGAAPTFVGAHYTPGEESGQYGLALGGAKTFGSDLRTVLMIRHSLQPAL
jgi:hypothetical protein